MSVPLLTTRRERIERTVVVWVAGEVDLNTAALMDQAILDAEAEPAATAVIVDLAGVDFFGSAGLAVLLTAHQRGIDSGISVIVSVPPSGIVHRTITITGVDRLLTLVDNLDHAHRRLTG